RELLLERIATALQVPAPRLQQWLAGAPVTEAIIAARRNTVDSRTRQPRQRGPGAGRGSLLTQAISLLLHFPQAATSIPPGQRQALEHIEQPAGSVLRELLAQQAAQPAASLAQTLERWRDRPEYRRLCELAA